MKTVGTRTRIPSTPAEAVHRAGKLIAEAFRVSPIQKPHGFVVKFKSWDDYENWRRLQNNPRFW